MVKKFVGYLATDCTDEEMEEYISKILGDVKEVPKDKKALKGDISG